MNEVITGQPPFPGILPAAHMKLLLIEHKRPPSIDRRPVEEAGDALLNDLADLVSDCWTDRPDDRPSACSVQSTLARLLFAIGGDPRFHSTVLCEAGNVPVSMYWTVATSNKSSSTTAEPKGNGGESTIQENDDESIEDPPEPRYKGFNIIPRSWIYWTATSKKSSSTTSKTKRTDVSAEKVVLVMCLVLLHS